MVSGALSTSNHKTHNIWPLLVIQLSNEEYKHVIYSLLKDVTFCTQVDEICVIKPRKRDRSKHQFSLSLVIIIESTEQVLKNGSGNYSARRK